MNRRLFICLLGAAFTSVSCPNSIAAERDWKYEMGWRYVKYSDQRGSLLFAIEPMVKSADVVYVPDNASWARNSPAWAKDDAKEILERLRSVPWHRSLLWVETQAGSFVKDELPIPGSLESTAGGKTLESYRLFSPTSNVTHEQAHEIWETAARRFAEATNGRVTVISSTVDPNTVFGAVELPALRANPNVTLDWK